VLNRKFHYIAKALDYLPADTVLDGELVALGPGGKPNFNLLQNFRSAESQITYYAFDVLTHKGRDLTQIPLFERRTATDGAEGKRSRCSVRGIGSDGSGDAPVCKEPRS